MPVTGIGEIKYPTRTKTFACLKFKMRMNTRKGNRNLNGVNEIDRQIEGDVALGRRQDVVSQVVIQRNLRQTRTRTNQTISSIGNQDDLLQVGPNEQSPDRPTDARNNIIQINQRNKWSKEEYIGIIEAYYQAVEIKHPSGMMAGMYAIWREKHPNIHREMNVVKLNNQRNYIIRSKKLTTCEIEAIKSRVRDTVINNQGSGESENVNGEDNADILTTEQHLNPNPTLTQDNDQLEFEIKLREKLAEVSCIPMSERNPINKLRYGKNTNSQIKIANNVIRGMIDGSQPDLTELNNLIYATASLIAGERRTNIEAPSSANNKEPQWSKRINRQIAKFRYQLSIIKEYKNTEGVVPKKVRNKLKQIMNGTDITTSSVMTFEQVTKMKLQAKSQRMQRYKKRKLQYDQNKLFDENRAKLYRQLNSKAEQITEIPKKEELESFWRSILENKQLHHNAEWMERIERENNQIPQQNWFSIDVKDLVGIIGRTQNWKAPGPDKIQNFWIKKFTSVHQSLAYAYNTIINEPDEIPNWLTEGSTYLLYKGKCPKDPRNYRPITCLPTMYKILTSFISNSIYNHLIGNNILPIEQKGCRKTSQGCKDQLLIDKMVTESARKKQLNISMAWIDYKKAFDSVPHSWIIKTLSIYKVNSNITKFIAKTMSSWRTRMHLYNRNSSINTEYIYIKRGIFQGDSLSPLLFCMAITPLSQLLSKEDMGYKISDQRKINHLLYMDDIKLYAKNEYQLEQTLKIVHEFSNDIRMEFGLDKCAKITLKHGKVVRKENININESTSIRELEHAEFYKYLGADENDGINHEAMRAKLKTEYIRRIRLVLRSELNARNKIEAINSIALPVIQYSFGVIEWTEYALERINRKTRKYLTMNGMHHPKADIHRLYLPRKEGGRGLMDLVTSWKTSIVQLGNYINKRGDSYMSLVEAHENSKPRYSVTNMCSELCSKYESRDKEIIKKAIIRENLVQYREKPLHGQFLTNVDTKQFYDKYYTFNWLRRAGLKGETESLLIAAQDQALNTKYHQKNILRQTLDSKCRLCHQFEEHISHIISGCPILAGKQYLERHNRVASYVHWQLLKKANIEVSRKWYEHQPIGVTEKDNVVIMWDFPIITDRTINANRPDIVYHNRNTKECWLIDVAIPDDANIAIKEAEKLSKYRDLEIEIHRMWKAKTSIVPVIVGALGSVTRRHHEHLSKIPCFVSPTEVQKIAILGTANVIRKFLDIR